MEAKSEGPRLVRMLAAFTVAGVVVCGALALVALLDGAGDSLGYLVALPALLVLLLVVVYVGARKRVGGDVALMVALSAGLVGLLFLRFCASRPFYIPSGGMSPTFLVDDKMVSNMLVYRLRPPRRGDVVLFKAPPHVSPDEKLFIKRLIGLPGDTIEVRDGALRLNGKPLRVESTRGADGQEALTEHLPRGAGEAVYTVAEPPTYSLPPMKVHPGRVFVLGDNRNDSNDSHVWGGRPEEQLEQESIVGRARAIFWPIGRAGRVR